MFVAATNGAQHLGDLFDLAGLPRVSLSFNRENGAAILGRVFTDVRRQDLTSYAEFPDVDAAQAFLRTIYPDAVVPPVRRSAPLSLRTHGVLGVAAESPVDRPRGS